MTTERVILRRVISGGASTISCVEIDAGGVIADDKCLTTDGNGDDARGVTGDAGGDADGISGDAGRDADGIKGDAGRDACDIKGDAGGDACGITGGISADGSSALHDDDDIGSAHACDSSFGIGKGSAFHSGFTSLENRSMNDVRESPVDIHDY